MLVRSEGLPNSDAGMRFATTTANLQSNMRRVLPKRTLFDGSRFCSRGLLVDAVEYFKVPGHAYHQCLSSCHTESLATWVIRHLVDDFLVQFLRPVDNTNRLRHRGEPYQPWHLKGSNHLLGVLL